MTANAIGLCNNIFGLAGQVLAQQFGAMRKRFIVFAEEKSGMAKSLPGRSAVPWRQSDTVKSQIDPLRNLLADSGADLFRRHPCQARPFSPPPGSHDPCYRALNKTRQN